MPINTLTSAVEKSSSIGTYWRCSQSLLILTQAIGHREMWRFGTASACLTWKSQNTVCGQQFKIDTTCENDWVTSMKRARQSSSLWSFQVQLCSDGIVNETDLAALVKKSVSVNFDSLVSHDAWHDRKRGVWSIREVRCTLKVGNRESGDGN